MRHQDVARIAQTAPALRGLVVAAMPDGHLIEHWARDPSDADAFAATTASVTWAAIQAAQTTSAGGPDLVSIETAESFIFAVPLGSGMCGGFVFDRGTSLGLARVHIKDMLLELGPLARGQKNRSKPAPAVPILAPDAPETPAVPPPTAPPRRASSQIPAAESHPPPAPPSSPPPPPPQVVPPSTPPVADGRVAPPPAAAPAPGETASGPPSAATMVDDLTGETEQSRAARLLAYLHRYAPDPHISLLRLSLRTGISLEKLDRPEQLTQEQVESMAACVRDIVGQDQLGI